MDLILLWTQTFKRWISFKMKIRILCPKKPLKVVQYKELVLMTLVGIYSLSYKKLITWKKQSTIARETSKEELSLQAETIFIGNSINHSLFRCQIIDTKMSFPNKGCSFKTSTKLTLRERSNNLLLHFLAKQFSHPKGLI
jgi:hypothetical protein